MRRLSIANLSSGELISITRTWIGPQRPLLLSIPKTAPFIEDLDQVHTDLVSATQALKADETLAKLTAALRSTDRLHDAVVNVFWGAGMSTAGWWRATGRSAEADTLEALINRLLPEGLALNKKPWREEAGYADTVAASLDETTRALLQGIPVGSESLLMVVETWIVQGRKLGTLETQRSILRAETENAMDEKEARSAWLETVGQVLDILEKLKGHDQTVLALRQPVMDAVAAAERRSEQRSAGKTADEGESQTESTSPGSGEPA